MPADDTLYAVLLTWPLHDDEYEPTDGSLVVVVQRFNSTAERDAFLDGVQAVLGVMPEDLYLDAYQAVTRPQAFPADVLRKMQTLWPHEDWSAGVRALDAAQSEVRDAL